MIIIIKFQNAALTENHTHRHTHMLQSSWRWRKFSTFSYLGSGTLLQHNIKTWGQEASKSLLLWQQGINPCSTPKVDLDVPKILLPALSTSIVYWKLTLKARENSVNVRYIVRSECKDATSRYIANQGNEVESAYQLLPFHNMLYLITKILSMYSQSFL